MAFHAFVFCDQLLPQLEVCVFENRGLGVRSHRQQQQRAHKPGSLDHVHTFYPPKKNRLRVTPEAEG
jgi:hypothetical protein